MSNTIRTALVAGASGITGQAICRRLVEAGWTVHGLARRPTDLPGVRPVAADMLDPAALGSALSSLRPDSVFFCSWLRQPTEKENIRVNSALIGNLLDALRPAGSLRHVALVTGLKHYLGPFESYGKGHLPETPFREEQPRLPIENFYYAQEDVLFAAAARDGFSWSVHRPHTVIGHAVGNAMNMGSTLAAYASICRETGLPFRFPGSAAQWNGLSDMTDARQLADQLFWADTTDAAADMAFNIVNGDLFRWNWLWPRIAERFELEAAPFDGTVQTLESQQAALAAAWTGIAKKHGLAELDFFRVASPWHTDADLGRPIEVNTDMSLSRSLGFTAYRRTDQCFFDLFEQLRADRLIP